MATNNRANRGKTLERAVLVLFERYAERGIHCQQNHPRQLHDGTLVERHGFDFQILYNTRFYAFDAKECAKKRWPLDKATLHQLKALYDVENHGGEAFFLVHFTTLHKLVKYPAHMVQTALASGVPSLRPEDGHETTLNLLGIE